MPTEIIYLTGAPATGKTTAAQSLVLSCTADLFSERPRVHGDSKTGPGGARVQSRSGTSRRPSSLYCCGCYGQKAHAPLLEASRASSGRLEQEVQGLMPGEVLINSPGE